MLRIPQDLDVAQHYIIEATQSSKRTSSCPIKAATQHKLRNCHHYVLNGRKRKVDLTLKN